MTNTGSTLDEQLLALMPKALDPFAKLAIEGARRALADAANPLRLNFFSVAVRILLEHMMATLAPDEEVVKCRWFEPVKDGAKPTRAQRLGFALQGGLQDEFVRDRLGVDVAPLRKRLVNAFNNLSKHVHGREDTIIQNLTEQDAEARATVEALDNFLTAFRECRSAILDPIQQQLDDKALDALLEETIQEVDELATHHSIDDVNVDETFVKAIGADAITYGAVGTVEVILQWGSNSDVRRGDGIESAETFPFHCDITVPLDDPWDLSLAETSYGVNTDDWYGDREPDDLDEIPVASPPKP